MKVTKIILILILIIIISTAGMVFFAFKVEPHMVTTSDMNIKNSKIQKSIRIVVFADTHFSSSYTMSDFKKAVSKINEAKPDVIIFLGDLYDNYQNYHSNVDSVISSLKSLNATYGKYAVFGNHDYGGGAENHYASIMHAGGFTVLKNERINFYSHNITITGIDDCLIGYGNTTAASSLNSSSYNIVLCHEPDIADKLKIYHINLILSAHTHGGQVRLPFYSGYLPSLGRKYVNGEYDLNNAANTKLYVNRGLGTTHMQVRFRSEPEITIINLAK